MLADCLQKVFIKAFWLTRAFCKTREIEAGKALFGCLERPPCKLRPSTMLVLSGQNACSEHAECLFGASKSLVPAFQKGSWPFQSGFWERKRGYFPFSEAVSFSLSNVRISLLSYHKVGYVFSSPFFCPSPAEGRKNGFSGIRKVKVSECNKVANGFAMGNIPL